MTASQHNLSRREREIMDAVYARGQATATEVLEAMAAPPTRTAVRTMLRILEAKGFLKHTRAGREFVYRPTRARQQVGRSALRRVLDTFFDGSLEKAVAAHLAGRQATLCDEEIRQLEGLIRQARRKGDKP